MLALRSYNQIGKLLCRIKSPTLIVQLPLQKCSSSSTAASSSPAEIYKFCKYAILGTGSWLIYQRSNFIVQCEAGRRKIKKDKDRQSALKRSLVVERLRKRINDKKKEKEPKFQWKEFFKILLPHWKYLLLAVGSALVVAFVNIKIPSLLGDMVNIISNLPSGGSGDSSLMNKFDELVKGPVQKLLSFYLVQTGFTFLYIYSLSCVGERVAADLRKKLFGSIINQDIEFFDSHMTGEIVNRLTSDIQEFKSSFKNVVSNGLRSICQTIGCMYSIYYISPEMTGATLISIPCIILIGSIFGSFLRKLSRKAQEQLARSTSTAEEAISNVRTVVSFSMQDKEYQLYSEEVDKARELNETLGVGIGIFQAGTNLFLNGVVLGVIYLGGRLISTNQLNSGQLMSFLVASQTIQRSLQNLSLLFGQTIRGLGSGARIFEFCQIEPTIIGKGLILDDVKGNIEFKNVHFTYPTRPGQEVIRDFSLKIESGGGSIVVALVGSSGCGKSTIIGLLERFYDINKGEITIDGHNIKELDLKWLRGNVIGIISQEPILFATSILENIRYGKPNATDDEVYEAARQANAFEFIEQFPRKFDTVLGERGVTVSGGQKQRIAIARALIKQPTILILDEATSALDSESEKIVQKTLDEAIKVNDRTTIVIAHRLSTIKNADLIAVIENGQIMELGNHKELFERGGLYHHFIKQQEILSDKAKA